MPKKLFEPYTIKHLTLKNRIVMSPMCMYSCDQKDGKVNDWHLTHYTSRAVGQVGLVVVEASAVTPQGRISEQDLGIWSDDQVEGLKRLVDLNHKNDSKIGIQLAHAGRKAVVDGSILSPSAIAFSDDMKTPEAMTTEQIKETIAAFGEGARRAREAGFDVIELHGAHGYLVNQFLSPLTNKRDDEYGGSRDNRFRFLEEIITAVKKEWSGPLFVRLSVGEYAESGNEMTDFIYYAKKLKTLGIDLIDCSSGGVVPAKISAYPGYQVPGAETLKKEADIATGAVGLITQGWQAEEILRNERADLVFLARELLRDPYWPRTAAKDLNTEIEGPKQYTRGWAY